MVRDCTSSDGPPGQWTLPIAALSATLPPMTCHSARFPSEAQTVNTWLGARKAPGPGLVEGQRQDNNVVPIRPDLENLPEVPQATVTATFIPAA